MLEEWQARAVGEGGTAERSVAVPGRPSAFAGVDAVRYRTRFPDPRSGDDAVAVLRLAGLYAHATVDVTGQILGSDGPIEHDAYFEPLSVPLKPAPDNELVVTCRSPQDRFGGLHDTDMVPDRDAVPGIWWDASLETAPLPCLDRIDVHPELTDGGARLHVRTRVLTDGPLEGRLTYSLTPADDGMAAGRMERTTVTADGAGVTVAEHTIDVRDPALWWPRELGDQQRYTLRAKLDGHEHSVSTGVCETTLVDGQLRVNGEPLPVRGINLVTADGTDVERALEVNANLVRGHAHVLPPALYRRCDEQGLLVWQDLPLTGPGPFDTDRGRVLAGSLARTYSRHPSLAVYGVHDDPVAAFPGGLGAGFLDRLRLRWRAWQTDYDPVPAETVADALPDTEPVVPVIGGPGVEGDVAAYYPGWDYGVPADVDALLDRYPADLVAEFGAGALADDDTTDAAGFDAARHDRHADRNADASQAYQADLLRRVTVCLRRRGVGAVAFALRDTDRAGMGVYAADGTPKAARDHLARAFEPVQAFLTDPGADRSAVVLVNDRPSALSTTLAWEAGEQRGEFSPTVEGRNRWTGGPIPSGAERVVLRLRIDGRTVENVYDR
ncbi:MAG: hydrolase [Halovenus sp.]